MRSKFTFLFCIVVFCFSCGYLPRIEKRHFRNGFYVSKKSDPAFNAAGDSCSRKPVIFSIELKTETVQGEQYLLPLPDSITGKNQNAFVTEKRVPGIFPKAIDLPKEPFNKKAKVAVVFYVLTKIALLTTFIVSLFCVLSIVFIFVGIAIVFALLALVFGMWAKKELAAQLPYEKELGENEANDVVKHALGGIGTAVFVVLLALLIEWIKRQ
jgi:hypothetical protein